MIRLTHPQPAKYPPNIRARLQKLNLWMCVLLLIAVSRAACAQEAQSTFPGFRHVDAALTEITKPPGGKFILQTDADFAPWSFLGQDGQLKGISVDLAAQACAEAGLTCELQPKEFSALLPALRSGQAQGIISGLKLDVATAKEFALTRPYFRSLGRFVARAGSSFAAPDIRSLAGRRIGFRANTAHARFLETYYSRSALTPFDSTDLMLEALRTGQVDVVFSDAVQLSFWLNGNAARGCCMFLGKAFVDRATFSRSLSFVLRGDASDLRNRLDAALDHMETTGVTAEIFARYLPASVW
jgi:polar amino acid transport system substrate-binding protein